MVENGEWLSFKVNYLDKHLHLIEKYEVLRCRVGERTIRTFLLKEARSRTTKTSEGFLLDTILSIRIPVFSKKSKDNEDFIRKQIEPYLKDYDEHRIWEEQFKKLDQELDDRIYQIYSLSDEEIKYVEENSRPTGWHVD